MHYATYILDTADFQWELAHLFEHVVIDGFQDYLDKNGVSANTFGYLNGDTFKKCVYLDLFSYDKKVPAFLDDYLRNLPVFSDETIDLNLRVAQAEERSFMVVKDKKQLKEQLDILRKRQWVHLDNVSPSLAAKEPKRRRQEALAVQKSAKDFRDVSVITYADDLSDEEMFLLLRFELIVCDLISRTMYREFAGYYRGSSWVERRNDNDRRLQQFQVFTLRRGAHVRKMKEHLQQTLRSFDADRHLEHISLHFESYRSYSRLHSIPVTYYENTGIITSTKHVASLATKENIKSLLQKLNVHVRPAQPSDKDYFR